MRRGESARVRGYGGGGRDETSTGCFGVATCRVKVKTGNGVKLSKSVTSGIPIETGSREVGGWKNRTL